jgi:hypothetical protein
MITMQPGTDYVTPESAATLDRIYGTTYAALVVVGAYLPGNTTPHPSRLVRSVRAETTGRGAEWAAMKPKALPYPAA